MAADRRDSGRWRPSTDFDLSLCMFGSPARGAVRLRAFGAISFAPLSRVCYRTQAGWACGNRLHAQSGFAAGDGPPASTQAFPIQFLKRFAGILASWALTPTSRRRLALASEGTVHRHVDRGETVEARKARHRREDNECTAGARNPAAIVPLMPKTMEVLSRVRVALFHAMRTTPGLRDCHLACGPAPQRAPPAAADVDVARRAVCTALGIEASRADLHHPASPLRYGLFQAITEATEDPDKAPAEWLRSGAPLGVTQPIPAGGHFPELVGPAPTSLEVLLEAPVSRRNHPSFASTTASGEQPARVELQELLDAGYCRLYDTQAAAEQALGGLATQLLWGTWSR